jgi:4-hydroxybenzoate polyprenyltransferase
MGSTLRDLVVLCRPRQWAKNVFVLAPLLFSEQSFTLPAAVRASAAFLAFCLLSSAVYVFNDFLDRDADRRHPRKRERPLAAGRVSTCAAALLGGGLVAAAAGLAVGLLPLGFLISAALYLANSVLYCLWIKHKVIADVMAIALGFVLRLLGGCSAIEVEPSPWIQVCGFSLALVLGFGKRRTEIAQLANDTTHRPALENYDPAKLDTLLAITTAVTLVSYTLFTVAPDTVRRHGTANLIYSVPLVAYGLFRYLFKTQEGRGDGPTEVLLGDRTFALVGLLWALTVAVVLYWR